jgi:hypothetical protein
MAAKGGKSRQEEAQGKKLLTAVERLLDVTDNLVAKGDRFLAKAREQGHADLADQREFAAAEAINHFSNLTAISGGASALPALLPGMGSLIAMTGGTLADMGLMLKFEVEMAMVLSHVYGFDLHRPEERQLAFLLASVSTYEAKSGESFLADAARAEGVAIWNYAPRQVSKTIVEALTRIALMQMWKGFARALPLVGIAVNSSMNKVLTRRVGARCRDDLRTRRAIKDRS